jgi:hypothetical protein
MRADSTGSTRGAFYHGTVPPNNTSANANPSPAPPVHAHDRKSKRKPPAKAAQDEHEPRQSNHGPARSMADLASMAFASLGDDTDGISLVAPSTTTSQTPMSYGHGKEPQSAHSKSNKRAFGMEHTPLSANTAKDSTYSSALPESGSPPVWGRTQLSQASRGSVFSILSDDSQEMAGVLLGQGPRQNSSLYGTNFEDDLTSVTKSVSTPVPVSQTAQSQSQSRYYGKPFQQQKEMDIFSSLIQADYGTSTNTDATQFRGAPLPQAPPHSDDPRNTQYQHSQSTDYSEDEDEYADEDDSQSNLFGDEHSMDDSSAPLFSRMAALLDPTPWLCRNAKYDADGMPFFDDYSAWTLAGFFRHYLYNPFSPEFTSLQQFCWAIILGVVMGFYTAAWKIM